MDQDSLGTAASSDPQPSPRPAARTPPIGLRPAPFHILLAHPHCLFSQGLAAFLAAQHDVEWLIRVTDGQSAWRAIRTRRPHIALLDRRLDKLPETEIVQPVQAQGLATRCYLFGTDTDAEAVCAPWRPDAPGRISKDSGFEDLMAVLRGVAAAETVAPRRPRPRRPPRRSKAPARYPSPQGSGRSRA